MTDTNRKVYNDWEEVCNGMVVNDRQFFAISHQSYKAGDGAWEWVLAGYQWLVTRYQQALMDGTRQLNKDIIYEQGMGAPGL